MKKHLLVTLAWTLVLGMFMSGCGGAVPADKTEPIGSSDTQTEALPTESYEQMETAPSGSGAKCGDNITWDYDENTKTLRISGTGPMYDYGSGGDAPWSDLYKDIDTVDISSGVTTIGNNAFCPCWASNVTLPDTLTSIGNGAFYWCGSLQHITFPEGLTRIGDKAFSRSSLSEVVIPASMTEIGEYAFNDCDYLTSVTISGTALTVGNSAFKECYRVATLVLNEGIVSIEDYAFDSCSDLTEVTIPNSVTKIGEFSFATGNALKKATIGSGIVDITDYAFCNDRGLETLVIPATVKRIGVKAFMNSPLKEIYYGGTEEDWEAISIDNSKGYNSGLYSATKYYQSN